MAGRARACRPDFPFCLPYGIFCLESIDLCRNLHMPEKASIPFLSRPGRGAGRNLSQAPSAWPLSKRLADPKRLASPVPTFYSNQEPKKKETAKACRERPSPHLKFRTRSLSALSLSSWRCNDTPPKIEAENVKEKVKSFGLPW